MVEPLRADQPSRERYGGDLPNVFTHADAIAHGISDRRHAKMRSGGEIDRLARGIYLRPDVDVDPDLAEIAVRSPRATLCLTTALARHDLVDDLTFDIGRTEIDLTGQVSIDMYDPMRSIIGAYRLRHLYGIDQAHEALKRWLRQRGARAAALLAMAKYFPKAEPTVRTSLETLLSARNPTAPPLPELPISTSAKSLPPPTGQQTNCNNSTCSRDSSIASPDQPTATRSSSKAVSCSVRPHSLLRRLLGRTRARREARHRPPTIHRLHEMTRLHRQHPSARPCRKGSAHRLRRRSVPVDLRSRRHSGELRSLGRSCRHPSRTPPRGSSIEAHRQDRHARRPTRRMGHHTALNVRHVNGRTYPDMRH